ncbi:MAG: CaiB/BaiF CoA transferase family protein [Acidimicrobiia bacterium]
MTERSNDGAGGRAARPFLDGVRVLDVTGALAGPYATTILSDLGAEVIKVEPVDGDSLRRRTLGEAGPLPFDMIHRNKRSLAVDLKSPQGAELVRRLARTCDVLVENFRPGAMAGLGLAYRDLAPDCPDLVYCSISGFGQDGPMRDAKGIDLVAQAYAGLMSVTGADADHLAKAGFPVGDLGSAMWGVIGVLAALQRARQGGGGAYIDVSLADAIVAWSLWEVADYVATGEVPRPLGTAHRLAAPYQAFPCGDGQTLVIGAVDRRWAELCGMLGVPELADDPRFSSEYLRFRNHVELAAELSVGFARAGRDAWIERLRSAGIPCGPVNGIDEVVADEQFGVRGMFVRRPEDLGQPVLVNTPIVADGAPRITRRAPRAGEDTRALLGDLGLADDEIDALVAAGVVTADEPVAEAV